MRGVKFCAGGGGGGGGPSRLTSVTEEKLLYSRSERMCMSHCSQFLIFAMHHFLDIKMSNFRPRLNVLNFNVDLSPYSVIKMSYFCILKTRCSLITDMCMYISSLGDDNAGSTFDLNRNLSLTTNRKEQNLFLPKSHPRVHS